MFEERCEQWFAIQRIDAAPSVSALFEFWRSELPDLPRDLLLLALRRVIRRHKWRTPPAVADFREAVSADLSDRQDARRKLERAAFEARRGTHTVRRPRGEPPRPETLERLAATVGRLKRAPSMIDEDLETAKNRVRRQVAEMGGNDDKG